MKRRNLALLLPLLACPFLLAADSTSSSFSISDRAAVERVYYNHRLGTKPPFEEALPAATIEKLVRAEAKREAALDHVYGVKIKESEIADEVKRIDATTRAPEMLTEIKAALGNDAARLAHTVARPIVVERTLRARFENDNRVHAPQRRLAEQAREAALAAWKSGIEKQVFALRAPKAGVVNEITWQLTPRPVVAGGVEPGPAIAPRSPGLATPATASSASYAIEASAQIAQPLMPPGAPGQERAKAYFDDLPAELQQAIRAPLRKPGDVSAVIETPTAFLVFVAKEISNETLNATSLSIPKRSYDAWLGEQPEPKS